MLLLVHPDNVIVKGMHAAGLGGLGSACQLLLVLLCAGKKGEASGDKQHATVCTACV